MAELLDGDPYAEALAAVHTRENLYGRSIDDEDPYAEQIKLMNPYTEDLRRRTSGTPTPVTTEFLDIETNPYTRH